MSTTTQVFRIYIKATPERIWEAITDPEWNAKFGYPGYADYELKVGGAYRAIPTEEMTSFGVPNPMCEGEIVEVDAPRKLVQTFQFNFAPDQIAEGPRTLTYEIEPEVDGLTRVTMTHDVTDAPIAAGMISATGEGKLAEGGGGWSFILSDLKSLLETGAGLQG